MADVPVPLPWWIEVIQAADEWSIPPWEIAQESKVIWMLRRRIFRKVVRAAQKEADKHRGK